MRPRVDWMQRPGDDSILEVLGESGLILSPTVIAVNIDYTASYVRDRLAILRENGLVERVSENQGHYRITERGQSYLRGKLDADDLEN